MAEADIGMVGLGVMGRNLALNMADRGYVVAGVDRDKDQVQAFVDGERADGEALGYTSPQEFVSALKSPRRIMIMVPAGPIVDAVIAEYLPLLEPGDVLIDGGNTHFPDTKRRVENLADKGIHFIGMGVSGGEEGARHGPSLMPGGDREGWPMVKDLFQAIAAKADDGAPCCSWVGREGAGHFVKMVHNGIEYSDMQLICEAYYIMQEALGLDAPAMGEIFREWNEGELDSYLIAITADILATQDDETGKAMVDVILDTAGQKGTGKWTSQIALDLGIPAATMAEAVFARTLSAIKDERVKAAAVFDAPRATFEGDHDAFIEEIRRALYASKICCYAQGFALMQAASEEYGWDLDLGDISLLWREGCIIRARFLYRIKEAYGEDAKLTNLMLAPYFANVLKEAEASWRRVAMEATRLGIPVPAFSSALAYFDGYRRARLPANLLQAQRDFFGAHTFERVDKPRGTFFHHEWNA